MLKRKNYFQDDIVSNSHRRPLRSTESVPLDLKASRKRPPIERRVLYGERVTAVIFNLQTRRTGRVRVCISRHWIKHAVLYLLALTDNKKKKRKSNHLSVDVCVHFFRKGAQRTDFGEGGNNLAGVWGLPGRCRSVAQTANKIRLPPAWCGSRFYLLQAACPGPLLFLKGRSDPFSLSSNGEKPVLDNIFWRKKI